jgi:phage recombination protein Bet
MNTNTKPETAWDDDLPNAHQADKRADDGLKKDLVVSNSAARQQPIGIIATMAAQAQMNPRAFEATMRATIFPPDGTVEQFAAFLMVAHEYKLNPLVKEIYAYPDSRKGIVPIVSIDGWLRIINGHQQMDGLEFIDLFDAETNKKIVAVTCKIYRKDRSHPIAVTEYLEECNRGTEPWKKWPARMLRHKAVIQAARYAFGFSGIYDQDEFERIVDGQRQGQAGDYGKQVVSSVSKIEATRQALASIAADNQTTVHPTADGVVVANGADGDATAKVETHEG